MIRVLIADDQEVIRLGFRLFLKRVTKAFDLRGKPPPYQIAKLAVVVFRIMPAVGAVIPR